jgi:L-ascorbate metabolism protein UlaG (beta-lactamase superfamily)
MFEEDRIQTSAGELKMTFVGHGTLIFTFPRSRPASRDGDGTESGKVFHVDPYSRLADYEALPKADVILITHSHGDHFDPKAIAAVRKEGTTVVLTEKAAEEIPGGIVMKNGETRTVAGFRIEAVPAYNLVHKRPTGEPFHPRGEGNGYVLTFGATRVYVAGDTENIPEMKELKGIAIAFLPMNLPYTMSPEQAAHAAKAFRPKMLYPYHYGETDPAELARLLAGEKEIEVRIRRLK